MKYVIVIPDGAADFPLDELEGQTPFEAAHKPNTDELTLSGKQGTAATTPKGMPCGSDVCSMSLLGYDPAKFHTGRAPLEAEALGIEMSPEDWIFRVNLVTVLDGRMRDHSGGHISSDEGATLLKDFAQGFDFSDFDDVTLYPGVSYRNIMVDASGRRDWSALRSTPPHDIPGEPIRDYLPSGSLHDELLQRLIAQSEVFLSGHEINRDRLEMGELPVTHLWPWGQGKRPTMPSFLDRFGLRGAMITAVDLLAGIAGFIGWDRLDVPGQTSYHDTDYAAAGRHAIDALAAYDIVCVHIEAPDEASHASDARTKVAAIEAIDEHVVGPILEALRSQGDDWRMLYLPDHYTSVASRKHDPTPVPFAMIGNRVRSVLHRPFSEANAAQSDLRVAHGHELMEYFLRSGL